jgi:hypothetical protein
MNRDAAQQGDAPDSARSLASSAACPAGDRQIVRRAGVVPRLGRPEHSARSEPRRAGVAVGRERYRGIARHPTRRARPAEFGTAEGLALSSIPPAARVPWSGSRDASKIPDPDILPWKECHG